jgi:LAO/AO transport system kinase
VTGTGRALAASLRTGDRRALSKGITLLESTRPDNRAEAVALLEAVLPATGKAVRVAISGAPGAGKSAFIEQLGSLLTTVGHRVAVLAVDPTSTQTGGSILGDKVRMERLARDPQAYIRPSPAATSLGGVAPRTREASLLCEAAGFDVIIIETVGVGQSETAASDMVDCFLLLISPGGGDELQGIKRGIMELADIVLVTKADGELASAAGRSVADLRSAVHFLRRRHAGWESRVLAVSSLERVGIGDAWQAVLDHRSTLEATGDLARTRSEQNRSWLWSEIRLQLLARLERHPTAGPRIRDLEQRVVAGTMSPAAAAHDLLSSFWGTSDAQPGEA